MMKLLMMVYQLLNMIRATGRDVEPRLTTDQTVPHELEYRKVILGYEIIRFLKVKDTLNGMKEIYDSSLFNKASNWNVYRISIVGNRYDIGDGDWSEDDENTESCDTHDKIDPDLKDCPPTSEHTIREYLGTDGHRSLVEELRNILEQQDRRASWIKICTELSNMSPSDIGQLFSFCYGKVHNYSLPYILLDSILKELRCPLKAYEIVRSNTSTEANSLIDRLVFNEGLNNEGLNNEAIKTALARLAKWIRDEDTERDFADVVLGNAGVTLKLIGCRPATIDSVIKHLTDKLGRDFQIDGIHFIKIDFSSSEDPLKCIVANSILKGVTKIRFDVCKFKNNDFLVSVDTATRLSRINHLRINSCSVNKISENLVHFTNITVLGIRGFVFRHFPEVILNLTSLGVLKLRNGTLEPIPIEPKKPKKPEPERPTLTPKTPKRPSLNNPVSRKGQSAYIPVKKPVTEPEKAYRHIIPVKIKTLVNLKTLTLSSCGLTEIPVTITYIPSLVNLIIANNRIRYLPLDQEGSGLFRMKSLRTLIINGNRIERHPALANGTLGIEFLSVKTCNFTELPDFLSLMPNLQRLNCSMNYIRELPASLHRALPLLKELIMYNNQINVFPHTLTSMQHLRTLNLQNNGLDVNTISNRYSPIPMLEKLVLSDNPLEEVPEYILKLTALKKLDMFNCRITRLPEGIRNLVNLTHLVLTNNPLSDGFPSAVTDLRNLVVLSLGLSSGGLDSEYPSPTQNIQSRAPPGFEAVAGDNRVGTATAGAAPLSWRIPDSIGNLVKLTNLSLNRRNISSIPRAIGNLVKMRMLNLSNNNLGGLPEEIGSMLLLRTLLIDNNSRLSSLPEATGNLISLVKLIAKYTSIRWFPREFKRLALLKVLNIGYNRNPQAEEKIPNEIEELQRLGELNCHSMWINSLDIIKGIFKTIGLETLVLSRNAIESLPDGLGDLRCLKTLEIEKCSMTVFPRSISGLQSLTTLKADKNFISEIEGVPFSYVRNLQILTMSNNLLEGLPTDFVVKLSRLNTLNIESNPIPESQRDILGGVSSHMPKDGRVFNFTYDIMSSVDINSYKMARASEQRAERQAVEQRRQVDTTRRVDFRQQVDNRQQVDRQQVDRQQVDRQQVDRQQVNLRQQTPPQRQQVDLRQQTPPPRQHTPRQQVPQTPHRQVVRQQVPQTPQTPPPRQHTPHQQVPQTPPRQIPQRYDQELQNRFTNFILYSPPHQTYPEAFGYQGNLPQYPVFDQTRVYNPQFHPQMPIPMQNQAMNTYPNPQGQFDPNMIFYEPAGDFYYIQGAEGIQYIPWNNQNQ